ncbi:hypothetical protein [Fredinandcohnia quinoae]|nr:hypothetical protein [Fredinandcohnia sp. SECRCQ15]
MDTLFGYTGWLDTSNTLINRERELGALYKDDEDDNEDHYTFE